MRSSLLMVVAFATSTISWAACDPVQNAPGVNTATEGIITLLNVGATTQVEINNKAVTVPNSFDQYAELNDFDTFIFNHDGSAQADRVFSSLLLARGTSANVKFNLRGCHAIDPLDPNKPRRAKIFSVLILD